METQLQYVISYLFQLNSNPSLVLCGLELIPVPVVLQPSQQEISQALADIRQLIGVHGHEHRFNGRAVARIFHGISSPCFPAQTWGRARRFWRSNMNLDFNVLVRLAVQEIVKLR